MTILRSVLRHADLCGRADLGASLLAASQMSFALPAQAGTW